MHDNNTPPFNTVYSHDGSEFKMVDGFPGV